MSDSLQLAREHFQSSSEMSSGPRWEAMLERMRVAIPKFTSSLEAIHYGQSSLNFDHRAPANDVTVPLCSTALANEFPEFAFWLEHMGDSELSRPESLIPLGSGRVSNVFYYHLRYVMTCLRYVNKPSIVCEIGGGYGGPARLWMLNPTFAPQSYVLIDFPESLFFAEVFLRETLPHCSVHYVTDGKIPNARIVLCPISWVKALEQYDFDLVINTGSMQEMSEWWVNYWMDWLDRQSCRHFYSLNYFAQPLANMAESGNTWSPRLSNRWSFLLQTFNPPFTQIQSARNFAELVAAKTDYGISQMRIDGLFHGQTFLLAMNSLMRNPSDDYCWKLLRYSLRAADIPKEAYWLAAHLMFTEKHNKDISDIMERLMIIRKSGSESVYV